MNNINTPIKFIVLNKNPITSFFFLMQMYAKILKYQNNLVVFLKNNTNIYGVTKTIVVKPHPTNPNHIFLT